ncbi:MAG TPA: tail fiber protein [Acidimicrobiales bacterium]|jgi:microcystin-dependent protein|nr:tail fiber protein [Acidimicrobiales bacterium]
MANPFIGEIRMAGFNFAPVGWAFCDGSLLAISQNSALFNLIGTTYGGDGQTTFALPDLRGRMALHQGSGAIIGQTLGEESVALGSTAVLPAHSHAAAAVTNHGNQAGPAGAVWAAASGGVNPYSSAATNATLHAGAIATATGGLAHDNMSPFAVINFVIALEGIFPSQ